MRLLDLWFAYPASGGEPFFDIWRFHHFVGVALVVLYLSLFTVRRLYGWLVGITLGYSLLSSLVLFQSTKPIWGNLQPRIDVTSAQAFIYLGLVVAGVSVLSKRGMKNLLKSLAVLSLIDSLLIVFFKYGFFNNPSMDGTFVTLLIPYVASLNVWLVPISLLGIGFAGETTPYLVLAAMLGTYFFYKNPKLSLLATLNCLGFGYLFLGPEFLSPRGRFTAWDSFMNWWVGNANPWIGTGYGSFHWIGPAVQENLRTGYFLFMHNEYLQILFEGGVIGLALSLSLWIYAIVKARFSAVRVSLFAGMSVAMLTQYPLRYFLTQVLVACLLRESLARR